MISSRFLLSRALSHKIIYSRPLSSTSQGSGSNGDKNIVKKSEKGGLKEVKESRKEPFKPFKPREEWLPVERPWEQGLPDHMKPQYPEIVYPDYDIEHPKVDYKFSEEELAIMHPMQARFRYPQFDTYPQPLGQVYESFKEDKRFHGEGRVWRTDDENIPQQCDVIIIGGGIIGTAIAYMLKQRAPDSFTVMVIEKDMTYSHASSVTSLGGIRQQFSVAENVQMSMFAADFLRNAKNNLSILDDDPPDIKYQPHGYLFLAGPDGAEDMLANHAVQINNGAYVDIFEGEQLSQKYPWLNTEGILLGAHGAQNEGWFDPLTLLIAMRGKAEFWDAKFVNAEFVDFNTQTMLHSQGIYDDTGDPLEKCGYMIIRTKDGKEKQIRFMYAILATGADTGEISRRCLKLGTAPSGIRSIPCPIIKKKRYVYVFNCPNGPGLDFPYLVDPSGVWCRREGLGGNFVCGGVPHPNDEPDTASADVDYNFFEQVVWPVLRHRVPVFENLKIVGAWSSFQDYNYFDQNGIVGTHPYYWNVFTASGFGGAAVQMAPAVGRAITEQIIDHKYKTIDLSRLGWSRILGGVPIKERLVI